MAVESNSPVMTRALLEYCTSIIDAINCMGQTPLFVAVKMGLYHMVELLIDCGADVAVTDYVSLTSVLWFLK